MYAHFSLRFLCFGDDQESTEPSGATVLWQRRKANREQNGSAAPLRCRMWCVQRRRWHTSAVLQG